MTVLFDADVLTEFLQQKWQTLFLRYLKTLDFTGSLAAQMGTTARLYLSFSAVVSLTLFHLGEIKQDTHSTEFFTEVDVTLWMVICSRQV